MRLDSSHSLLTAGWLATVAPAAEFPVSGCDLLGEGFVRAVAGFGRQNDTGVKLELRGTRPVAEDLEAGRADVGICLLSATELPPAGEVVSRTIGCQVVVAVPAASALNQVTVALLREAFGETGQKDRTPLAVSPRAGLAWPLFQRVILLEAVP